jgi:hypothetical protein
MASAGEWAARLRASQPVVWEGPDGEKEHGARRYSPGLMTILGIAEDRVLGGLAKGADAYRSRSERSAHKRKDGAVRDFAENVMRSPEKFVDEVAKVPRDFTESRTWKRMRRRAGRVTVRLLEW